MSNKFACRVGLAQSDPRIAAPVARLCECPSPSPLGHRDPDSEATNRHRPRFRGPKAPRPRGPHPPGTLVAAPSRGASRQNQIPSRARAERSTVISPARHRCSQGPGLEPERGLSSRSSRRRPERTAFKAFNGLKLNAGNAQ